MYLGKYQLFEQITTQGPELVWRALPLLTGKETSTPGLLRPSPSVSLSSSALRFVLVLIHFAMPVHHDSTEPSSEEVLSSVWLYWAFSVELALSEDQSFPKSKKY